MIDPGTDLGGKYRVVRLLGEGGMGAVYEAEHLAIARRVAVKVLHARYKNNEQATARFEREARAAGAIGHDNIVEVLDFGVHRDVPYLVMELLKGETLSERLATSGTIAPAAACRITGQVLSALASAHAAGIVHRDLKLENLFLVARGEVRDVVKLLDFGISKFQRADGSDRVMTQDGTMLGTPAYMAPEQWMGRRDVDHRADLFSVGVMLYEMLTGGLPYEGETQGELFLEIVKGTLEPPPPSEIAPGVPAVLDAIVLRAIRRDRDARFQTAQEFLEALRRHGAGGIPVVARGPAPASTTDALGREDARTSAGRRARAAVSTALASHGGLRGSRGARVLWVLVVLAVLGGGAGAAARFRPARPAAIPAELAPPVARPAPVAMRAPETQPPIDPGPESPVDTAPASVQLELRELPPDAQVLLDGVPQAEGPLRLPRGDGHRTLEIRSALGRRTLTVRPDRDQVIVVDVAAPVAARNSGPSRAAASHAAPSRAPAPRRSAAPAPRPGLGEMNLTHEF